MYRIPLIYEIWGPLKEDLGVPEIVPRKCSGYSLFKCPQQELDSGEWSRGAPSADTSAISLYT